MSGEEKLLAFAAGCAVFVLVALIGGCTITFNSDVATTQMKNCLATGMEWRGGDCVRPEVRP